MTDGQPPRSVFSSAWTGPPPETRHGGTNRGFRPRSDPVEQRTHNVTGLLLAGCLLAFLVWYVALGSHSPTAPSPETGQTVALRLFSAKGPPIFVTLAEALATCALLVAAFAIPLAYLLGREALDRRRKR